MVYKDNNITYFDTESAYDLHYDCMLSDDAITLHFKYTHQDDKMFIDSQNIQNTCAFVIRKLNALQCKSLLNIKDLCITEYFNTNYIDSVLEDIEKCKNYISWTYLPSICDIMYECYNNRNKWITVVLTPTMC